MKPHLHFLVSVVLALSCTGGLCQDILLHKGPTVSTPISSLSSPERTSEELIFVKEFHVDSSILSKLPRPHQTTESPAISATRAIELAKNSVESGVQVRAFSVGKLELLTTKTDASNTVEFYVIEMVLNGSSESRVVLMDGSVIKPRLKRVAADPAKPVKR